jgi:hypothetical protein
MKKNQLLLWLLLASVLPACTAGEFSAGSTSTVPSRTKLSSLTPTETIDESTPTMINTIVAIPSPTEGLPPDLELLNLTLKYDGKGNGSIFGEIRNNTDTTMVFPVDTGGKINPILRLQIDAWDWDGWTAVLWRHEFSVGSGYAASWHTGCFLYPGETGLFSTYTPGCNMFPDNCVSGWTYFEEPPEATGMQLVGYQDLKTYVPWPDLNPGYHPQVENLEYSITPSRLDFAFELPKSLFNPNYDFMTWVVAYDENEKMLGILYKPNVWELKIDNGGDMYRIIGFYEPHPEPHTTAPGFFRGELLDDEDYYRIDHIRVMVEMEHTYLCGAYASYDSYREWIAEHPEFSGA